MATRDYMLSAFDEFGRRDFTIENTNGTQRFSQLSYAIDSLVEAMKTRKHHIRITFRTETLIWYEQSDGNVYRAHPLTTDEQSIVWYELLRIFPQCSTSL